MNITLVNLAADTVTGDLVMPLGALHIASALEADGHVLDLRDAQLHPGRDLVDLFETDDPVLGLSLMSDRLAEALFALRLFRDQHPDTLIVLGGAGPTEVAGPLQRAFPFVDAIVRGEGEVTVVDLMRAHAAGESLAIAGVSTPTGAGPDRPRMRDVDGLAYPACCRWDVSPYKDASLITARGCPFRCSYCSIVGLWGQAMAWRDVDAVVDEIAWLAKQKPGAYVHLEDDTFTVSRQRVVAFCDAMERRGLGVEWGCTGRVDQVDPDLARRMHSAGCRSIFLGIESGADRQRAQVGKRFSSDQVFDSIQMLLEHFAVTAHYIWGFPDETLAEFHETFLHIHALQAMGATARHSHLVPFPQAPIVAGYSGDFTLFEQYPFPRLFVLDPEAPWAPLVRKHRDVFLPHYCLDTPNRDAKFDIVAGLSRFERAS